MSTHFLWTATVLGDLIFSLLTPDPGFALQSYCLKPYSRGAARGEEIVLVNVLAA